MANAVMMLCGWTMLVILKTMGCGMGTWQYWVLLTLYATNNIAWMADNWRIEKQNDDDEYLRQLYREWKRKERKKNKVKKDGERYGTIY